MIIKALEVLKVEGEASQKREKKLAEKKSKKASKSRFINKSESDKTIPLDTVITLDHLTNPDKKVIVLCQKKASELDLKNALRKNLRKRKLFQKKNKRNDIKR